MADDTSVPDDPELLPEHPSKVEQIWIMVRILAATLLILVGFALAVGLLIWLT